MSKPAAIQAVAIIYSAYGQIKAEQEAFQRLAVQALEDYPDHILRELVSPKTGIIAKSKYPPSIAELHEWCLDRQQHLDSARLLASMELERSNRLEQAEKERIAWLEDLARKTGNL